MVGRRADDVLLELFERICDFLILIVSEFLVGDIEQDVIFFLNMFGQQFNVTAGVRCGTSDSADKATILNSEEIEFLSG